jgi:hypothetical protein
VAFWRGSAADAHKQSGRLASSWVVDVAWAELVSQVPGLSALCCQRRKRPDWRASAERCARASSGCTPIAWLRVSCGGEGGGARAGCG